MAKEAQLVGSPSHMILFTDGYPYGAGEKSFIEPEIEALSQEYRITLVAFTSNEAVSQAELTSTLPAGVELVTYIRPSYNGRSVAVYLPHALKFFFSRLGWKELRHLRHDGFTTSRLIDSIKQFALTGHLRSFCRKAGLFSTKEDIVCYCFWFTAPALAVAMEKRVNSHIKLVSRAHGYDLYNERQSHGRQPFQRIKRDAADCLIFISKTGRAYFEKTFGPELHDGQYLVNYLGSPCPPKYPSCEEKRGAFTIVSCSNVIPLKRVDMIARAVAKLNGDEVRWIHFGDGCELETIKEYCQSKDISAIFPGMVDNEKVIEYYATYSVGVFVSASSSEGLPVSIIEAESCGIPIIATDVGGVCETIDGNGILLSPNPSVDEITCALSAIMHMNQSEWDVLSQHSYSIWDQKFNVGKTKRELIHALHNI